MQITIKLFASLADHLPAGAHKNEAGMTVADGATVAAVITELHLPTEQCHLVLVNGAFVAPGERAARALNPGDALAIWPPVAGG